MLALALDSDGREVELTEDCWSHITAAHPELEPSIASVIRAVQSPDRRMPGLRPSEEWFYVEGVGPSRWLKVVVHYESGRGRIITAFGRRSLP